MRGKNLDLMLQSCIGYTFQVRSKDNYSCTKLYGHSITEQNFPRLGTGNLLEAFHLVKIRRGQSPVCANMTY